jgi:hypothetical protein
MAKNPPKKNRPKVRTIRTTKVGDPDINKIYIKYQRIPDLPDGYDFQENVLSKIKHISLSVANNTNGSQQDMQGTPSLTLSNVLYEIVEQPSGEDVDPQFYCVIQPTPNHAVNSFFNSATNHYLDIKITYYAVDTDTGSHLEVIDSFYDKPYIYPTEH